MKILIGSPTSTGIGGTARHVQELTHFLKSQGYQVDIISSNNTFTIPIKKLKNPSFMISAFVKSMFKKNFDIVHAQGPPAAFAMKNAKGKKVLSLHGIHHKQIKLLHGNVAGILAEKYEKFALEWADVITVSSKEMMDYYKEKGYDVEFIPNALDIENLPQGEDRRYDKQIIYAARLSKEKGIFDVLQMSKKLPKDIHLIILGNGPEKNKVEAISSTNPNVHYLGSKAKEETIPLIRGSDLLIQPSLMEGGISYTLLESMACHTPVICTTAGDGKEFFKHLENSFLIKPENHSQLLNAIEELFLNEEKRKKLSESAFNSIKIFGWKNIGQKYLDLYELLIS